MAKRHTYDIHYDDQLHADCKDAERDALLQRALESMRDLLDELARPGTQSHVSIEQEDEMEGIVKDAIRHRIY